MVLFDCDGHPEKRERYRPLGLDRVKGKARGKPGSKTFETNIRDGIKKRFERAFRQLLPDA
jgi:hypothetical protein